MGKSTSKCLIEIQLDQPDRAYKPGERIKGSVEILPGTDQKCRKVTLTARWAARGKGPEDAADHETIVFPGGAWRNNEKVTHTFDFAAPPAPLSYEGDSFDIRWYLVAEADLPHTKDAAAVKKFILTHGAQASIGDFSWQPSGAYNPFAALGSKTAKPSGQRYQPPAFYTLLNCLPTFTVVPVLAAIIGYFVGMRDEYFPNDYAGPIIGAMMILGVASAITGLFRRKMRARRREALNRQRMRPPESGARPPRTPGKFWLKSPLDDSQRGWPRSVFSLALGGLGLLLMVVGLINVATRSWSTESAAYLAAFVAGMIMAVIARRHILPSWRCFKARMTLGHVKIGLTPERIRCGDNLHVYVDFRASLPVEVSEAAVTLEAYEVAEQYFRNLRTMDVDTITERFNAQRNQDKKFRFARVRQIHAQSVALASGRTLLPQESASLSGKFAVPADAPPTFLAVGNKILCYMAVRLKLASGVCWSKDIPIYLLS